MINFYIDGQAVSANKGETILEVARREGMYIPTMCYLSRVTPISSCRICSVEADNTDGFVLSCNTPPVEGMNVTTNSENLHKYRQNIMKLYDVNHPLQCGVCDKSGECDLQNKTLELGVNSQHFSAKEHKRPIKNWGMISYDESLCILCEKCVSVCNEVTGYNALEIKYGGYSSHIKRRGGAHCVDCGECVSVCPVGAMHSTDFKYTANTWELKNIPASCSHCSSACSLEYEVKRESGSYDNKVIYRTHNDREFSSLCSAGRYGFDFENKDVSKDEDKFGEALAAFGNAGTIKFNSLITNEEALILQKLKELKGYKLINDEALSFKKFMKSYGSVTGSYLYSGDLKKIEESDYIITLGSNVATDNPIVKHAISIAHKKHKAAISYIHPIVDVNLKNVVTQFIKHEVGAEEGILAVIADKLLSDSAKESAKDFFNGLDIGYISGESNVGEEEFELLFKRLNRKKAPMLILGEDVINHPSSENIARLAGMINEHTDFDVVIIPPRTNSLGVSLICDLDEEASGKVIGYNEEGDFILSSLGDASEKSNVLDMPALNQQEGTFTNIDKRVVPTNAALPYKGYELNDIANVLGLRAENTIDYTKELGKIAGYKEEEFDNLPNYYTNSGEEVRGYVLEDVKVRRGGKLKEIGEIREFNGTVVYSCNPVKQFNQFTAKTSRLDNHLYLLGSTQFATAAKISNHDMVEFEIDGTTYVRQFKVCKDIIGTIALNPNFDGFNSTKNYRYNQVNIKRGL